ncbi:MAG: hypothetical protein KGL39_04045 [Patescibacteria group bacterium]|nr:hypothetical protein [Patescibacteria group bacterium]
MMNPIYQTIIQNVLKAAGAVAVANGVVTDAQWQTIAGAVVALVGVAWDVYQSKQHAALKQGAK